MYTIKKLADIAMISTRTLRYYDEIGLLSPTSLTESGYRLYDDNAVELLQHILFYKTLGLPLNEIKHILFDKNFDSKGALLDHRSALLKEQERINTLIKTVNKSIQAMEGQLIMTDKEKFEGLKEAMIDENEKKYGKDLRKRYGDKVDTSNQKIRDMDQETFENLDHFTETLNNTFREAMLVGDVNGDLANKACEMHVKWIKHFWDTYSVEAHLGLVNMYVEDDKFKAYYDKIEKNLASFIKEAMTEYLK